MKAWNVCDKVKIHEKRVGIYSEIVMGNILRFKKGDFVIEIEPFDQKINGDKGITYTLFPYPNGLSEDYDIDNLGSYDTLREAIEEAQKRLNMEVGEIDTK